MRTLAAAICVVVAVIAGALPSFADDVRIVRRDGSVVAGQLKGFEDGVYVVTTPAGEVLVDVGAVATIDVGGVPRPAPAARATRGASGDGPAMAKAADANAGLVTVTTTANEQIAGRITGFEDGIYEIETTGGVRRVPVVTVLRIEPANEGAAPIDSAVGAATVESKVAIALTGENLTISGSRTLGELIVRPLLETYAQFGGATNPIWTQRGSSSERGFQAQFGAGQSFSASLSLKGTLSGIDDLAKGNAQIAMLERRMTKAEAQRVAAAGLGDPLASGNEAIIGASAVVAVVHPSNPVKALTFAQAAGIFSGRIRNWNEVGGPNRRIQVLAPMPGSTLLDVAKDNLGDPFDILASARRTGTSLETADLVSADPASIGLAHTDYRGNTVALALTSGCGLTFEPTAFNIESETYPLWSRLFLYSTNTATRQSRDFLAFAQTPAAQRVLHDRGLGGLTPNVANRGAIKFDRTQAAKFPDASSRFLDIVAAFVAGAARVTVTFRFEPGSNELDGRAVADLDRLADFVKGGTLGGRTVALVGYSENTGNFTADVAQSKARAVGVSELLQKKGLTVERLFGFGPLLPVACDGAASSLQRNRRVEVWVE